MKPFTRFATLLLAVALLILFFSLLQTPEGASVRPYFLTATNFKFIAAQASVIAVGALGMTIIVACGGIDLSAGAILVLTHVITSALLRGEHSAWMALGSALAIGALAGTLNGSLTSLLKLSPVITTLGMAGVAGGLAQWIGQRGATEVFSVPSSSWLVWLMGPFPRWIAVSPGVWLALLLAVVLGILCRKTVFGRHLFAIGSSEEAAERSGVRVALVRTLVYMLGGAFFGLAGLLQTARLQETGPSIFGWTLDFLAAVAIGGTRFGGGRGSLIGTLFGALVIAILRNGSQQAGWNPAVQTVAVGAALIIALALQQGPRDRMAQVYT